jgi:hypothetical protein
MEPKQAYPLETPVNRKLYVPGEDESGFSKPLASPHSSQVDQTHRNLTWLFHRPQNHSIFPVETEPVKIGKKK